MYILYISEINNLTIIIEIISYANTEKMFINNHNNIALPNTIKSCNNNCARCKHITKDTNNFNTKNMCLNVISILRINNTGIISFEYG